MEIVRVSRDQAGAARGIVVVIDVIRAFTVAAHAFAKGAECLWLVRTPEEALALRRVRPDVLLAGEVGGLLIPGFDHNNSPSRLAAANVRGRLIVQRTGAGTQGAASAIHADHLLMCSLVNARATAQYAGRLSEETRLPVTLMPTNSPSDTEIEDEVCADYLERVLRGDDGAPVLLNLEIERLRASGRLDMFASGHPDLPIEDVDLCLEVDRFDFAMAGTPAKMHGIRYVEVVKVPTNV